ncbi:hypothetical protein E3P86_00905 [Wallemia ichthyophaga]|uniref:Uncharacterized protein n=1 Tax=Wallemia ichthyophaga TaxID=245174 RepID=A0A4T0JDL7_WALIC|nr:hypothetical protein E3P86_00905 [Wallemia ichthyophaga]
MINTAGHRRRSSIDPSKLQPMYKVQHKPGPQFNVMFIGAGNINFGSDEGPWNHSARIENKWGTRLRVTALVDPSKGRADQELEKKRSSFVAIAYNDTKWFSNLNDAVAGLRPDELPDAIIVGAPPQFRGGLNPPANLELDLIDKFPNAALFLEKPVTTGPAKEAVEVGKKIAAAGNVTSVGYMLRYSRAVQTMIKIIEENNLTVIGTVARYIAAYEKIAKEDWWDKARSCGPIVEQATHFCDLSRYFGGDVSLDTVQAHSVEWNEEPGKLSKMPINEENIKMEDRIPRFTTANWKYDTGAVGTLVHGVALHDTDYYTELTVYTDGHQLRLVDPYNNPALYIRKPGSNAESHMSFSNDDCFYSEISNWGDEIEKHAEHVTEEDLDTRILSTYEDAVQSYELTWAIRHAAEAGRKFPAQNVIIGPEPACKTDVDCLKRMGIKQILNTARECDDPLKLSNEFKYLKLDMIDNPGAINVQDFLNKGSDFIDDAKLHSRPIYVHCKAGKSRSVAIVIAHLIRANRWDINRAYDYVKQRRESASPNIGFIAELMLFQKDMNILDYSENNDASTSSTTTPHSPDKKLKSNFDGLTGCRTPSSRPLSAGPGVLTKVKQSKPSLEHRVEDDLKNRLHIQETLGNHSEVEKKDRSGRYIHPKRAPLDNRLQPLRRVSKAGLESATLDFLKEFDYEKDDPGKESIREQPNVESGSTGADTSISEAVAETETEAEAEAERNPKSDHPNNNTNIAPSLEQS